MKFNDMQQKAVVHRTGPCQVLAGPGSGKTLTVVNRIRYLIEECNVRPEEILVVTFTRYAAAEMKIKTGRSDGQKKYSRDSGHFSRDLLRDTEMGLQVRQPEYSFGRRKVSDPQIRHIRTGSGGV